LRARCVVTPIIAQTTTAKKQFKGVPMSLLQVEIPKLKCGVGVVDLAADRLIAHLEFMSGVEEIFDVQAVPGARWQALSGPYAFLDGAAPIWTVPQASTVNRRS
jgi:hypothetical protein